MNILTTLIAVVCMTIEWCYCSACRKHQQQNILQNIELSPFGLPTRKTVYYCKAFKC